MNLRIISLESVRRTFVKVTNYGNENEYMANLHKPTDGCKSNQGWYNNPEFNVTDVTRGKVVGNCEDWEKSLDPATNHFIEISYGDIPVEGRRRPHTGKYGRSRHQYRPIRSELGGTKLNVGRYFRNYNRWRFC